MGAKASGPKWAVWLGPNLYAMFESYDEAIKCARELRLLVRGRREEIAVRSVEPGDIEAAVLKRPEA